MINKSSKSSHLRSWNQQMFHISAQKKTILKMINLFSFSSVNHCSWTTEWADPYRQSLSCCTAMFLQQPRMDKPSTDSWESLFLAVAVGGEIETRGVQLVAIYNFTTRLSYTLDHCDKTFLKSPRELSPMFYLWWLVFTVDKFKLCIQKYCRYLNVGLELLHYLSEKNALNYC